MLHDPVTAHWYGMVPAALGSIDPFDYILCRNSFAILHVQDLVLLEPAVLVNSFDVTSQKEVEEQLEAAKKQLLM